MIAQLRGILLEKQPPELLIEVNGVGYTVYAPMSTFDRLPACGQEVILLIHMVIRQEEHALYGFCQQSERLLFRALIKVNGIGPRIALMILSNLSPDEFMNSILQHDRKLLIKIPGIGKKVAERLIIEMRDKLPDFKQQSTQALALQDTMQPQPLSKQLLNDAISALIALGYTPKIAKQAIFSVQSPVSGLEELIRYALRSLATHIAS